MGLKNHSEIGWVLREYDDILASALKLGIKSPDSYYANGKIKGKASRDKNIEGQKIPEKPTAVPRKFEFLDNGITPPDHTENVDIDHPLGKPSMHDIPNLMKRGKATEVPGLLEGFKSIRRK